MTDTQLELAILRARDICRNNVDAFFALEALAIEVRKIAVENEKIREHTRG